MHSQAIKTALLFTLLLITFYSFYSFAIPCLQLPRPLAKTIELPPEFRGFKLP